MDICCSPPYPQIHSRFITEGDRVGQTWFIPSKLMLAMPKQQHHLHKPTAGLGPWFSCVSKWSWPACGSLDDNSCSSLQFAFHQSLRNSSHIRGLAKMTARVLMSSMYLGTLICIWTWLTWVMTSQLVMTSTASTSHGSWLQQLLD